MKTKKITSKKMLALLEQAVETRGVNYVYPKNNGARCVYVRNTKKQINAPTDEFIQEDGDPACLIGLVLHLLDPDLLKNMTNDASINMSARDMLGGGEDQKRRRYGSQGVQYAFSSKAIRMAQAAQTAQDSLETWGTSLAAAHREMKS